MFKCDDMEKADSFVADSQGVTFTRNMARQNNLVSSNHFRAVAEGEDVLVRDLSSNGTWFTLNKNAAKTPVPRDKDLQLPLREEPKILVANIEFSMEPIIANRESASKSCGALFEALTADKAPITIEGIRSSGIGREIKRWAKMKSDFNASAVVLLSRYMGLVKSMKAL